MATILAAALCAKDATLCEVAADAARCDLAKLKTNRNTWLEPVSDADYEMAIK